jgi:hypothetical protein
MYQHCTKLGQSFVIIYRKIHRFYLFLFQSGYRLKNSILRSITAENQMTCAHHCALEKSKCKSFNFIADPTFTGNCELNFGKAQKPDDANLVPRNGMKYFEEISQDKEGKTMLSIQINSQNISY